MSDLAGKVVPVFMVLVLIGGGAYLYVSNQQATENAEAVDATVVSSEVYDADPGDAPNDRENDEYRASVEYRYTYAGGTYTSENLCPGAGSGCAPTGNTPDEAEQFVSNYPEGETVTAYVQPDDPSQAYLVDSGGSPLLYLGMVGAGLVVGGLLIRKHLLGGDAAA